MAVKIRYKGVDIAAIEPGKTTTVKCSGKKMKTDVSVTAEALKLQEKTTDKNGDVVPDSGFDGLSKVTVNVEGEVLPKYDGEVIIEGEPESGGGDGGSAEFNIAYGDTAPTDTSKLWVKVNEPEAVSITSSIVTASEELEAGISALPRTADGVAAATVGTKVYLFGGRYRGSGGTSIQDTINVFDTETSTIETLSVTLPQKAREVAAATVGTKIYLFGGEYGDTSQLNTINVFDTETNTIETLETPLPQKASALASAVVGKNVYLFGGYYKSGSMIYTSNAITVFNTETQTITNIATLPKKVRKLASAVVGTKVYLFGYGTSIYLFDTEANTIETLSATLPTTAAYNPAASAIGTKIYLFGGRDSDGGWTHSNVIYLFDTETEIIEATNTILPQAASNIAASAVGTKIYLCGGFVDSASTSSAINMFEASMPLASNNLLVEASATKNRFNLLPNVELGVNNVYLGNAEGNGEKVAAYLHNGTEWVEV